MNIISEKIPETKKAFVVWTNTDLTEGRGDSYPKAFCLSESTAIRKSKKGYVMGSDCPIKETELYYINGNWHGPICLECPNEEDKAADELLKIRKSVLDKAKRAGLTDAEIKILKESKQ